MKWTPLPGVAVPTQKGGCWAEVPFRPAPKRLEFVGCGNPPRTGYLTCVKHKNREEAARELQAKSSTSTST